LISLKDHLRVAGTDGTIFAVGDCTSTQYAPTAQVASQQGAYLARMLKQLAKRDALLEHISTLEKEGTNTETLQKQLTKKIESLRPFHYSHQGSLAYIGSEKAIADLEFFHHKVRLQFGHGDPVFHQPDSFPPAALRRSCSGGVLT
jgi:NADH:ubiquinone reductase (non-electrogenic)